MRRKGVLVTQSEPSHRRVRYISSLQLKQLA